MTAETMSTNQGGIFVAFCASYCVIALLLVVIHAIVRYRCRPALYQLCKAMVRLLTQDGKMEIDAPLDTAFLGFVATPASIFVVCIALGPLLAAAERWSLDLGVEYMLSNTMGLTQPLTNASPETLGGILMALVVSILGMLLVTMFMAFGCELVCRCRFWRFTNSTFSFIWWMFGFVPLFLLFLSVCIGGILATFEDWPFEDGFYFASAQIAGFANPITDVSPMTGQGCFVEVLCVSGQILIQSTVLDIITSHPVPIAVFDAVLDRGMDPSISINSGSSWHRKAAAVKASTADLSATDSNPVADSNEPTTAAEKSEDAADRLTATSKLELQLRESQAREKALLQRIAELEAARPDASTKVEPMVHTPSDPNGDAERSTV